MRMKTITANFKIFLLALLLLAGKIGYGQNYEIYITNDHLTSPSVLEFDVYIKFTSQGTLPAAAPFNIRTFQQAFFINPAFTPAGAAPTVTQTSGPSFSYAPGLIQVTNNGTTVLTFSGFQAASNGAGTCPGIGPNLVLGTSYLICTWKITSNTGPFNCVPHNLSSIRSADTPPGGLVNLRWAVTRWTNTSGSCNPGTSTTITTTGTFTSVTGGTLLSQMNNSVPTVTNPANVSVTECPGQVANFSVTATQSTGITTPAVSFQWLENGAPITNGGVYSGATSSQLTITNPTVALDQKLYSVVVTQCGTRTSSTATLSVTACGGGCANPPTANAGGPYVTCSGSVTLNGAVGGSATPVTGGTWSSPTAGTFTPNANTLNAVYTPSAADLSTGSVTLTLTSDNPLGGQCVPFVSTALVTFNAVDDNNPCTADVCNTSTGSADHTPLTNTNGASDNDPCTADNCLSGQTVHPALPTDDGNVCTTDGCNSNGIFHTPLTNSNGATDNDPCTADNCLSGQTVHPTLPTDDGNVCTADGCDSNGIFHTPLTNLNGATDNDPCTADNCVSGVTTHPALSTDDGNVCTADGCNSNGIFHTPLTNSNGASDNNPCTADNCVSGVTTHPTLPTDDGNVCTADGCNSNGIFHTPLTNSSGATDNDPCTADNCVSGQTVHVGTSSDDGNPCTADGCNSNGIFHTPLTNSSGATDNNPCTADNCVSGVTTHPTLQTDDGNVCTADGCNSNGVFHTPLTNSNGATDNDPCTADNCVSGQTVHIGTSSDDGNPCTADGCNSNGVFHTPLTNTGGGASDFLLCTDDNCSSGQTVHPPVNVDDQNPCTQDGCLEDQTFTTFNVKNVKNITNGFIGTPVLTFGVFHIPLTNIGGGATDNNVCTSDDCVSGQTVHVPTAGNVDDNNPCTIDGCNSITGSESHTPVTSIGGGASDNNLCTDDNCSSGTTVHPPIAGIDDNNPCTNDACDSGVISHFPVTDGLPGASDNNACTTDACLSGQTVYTPIPTNDDDLCTLDGCNSITGVFHNPTGGGGTGPLPGQAGNLTGPGVYSYQSNHRTYTLCAPGQGGAFYTYCLPAIANATGYYWWIDRNANPSLSFTSTTLTTTYTTSTPCVTIFIPFGYTGDQELEVEGFNCAGNGRHNEIVIKVVSPDDNNPCTIDACSSGIVTHVNNKPVASAVVTTPILCYNGTGCVTVQVAGGATPYNYNLGLFNPDTTICNVSAGSGKTFTFTDANGCSFKSTPVNLTQPSKLNVSTSQTPSGCNTNTGTAKATPSGGTPGYQYLWSPGGQTTQTATGLAPGSYSVTVTDANGCTATKTVTVLSNGNGNLPAPGPISGTVYVCDGQCITYSIQPVQGAISYQWTLPNGASGSSTSTSITVCFNSHFRRTGGSICVRAVGSCGTNPSTCLTLIPVTSKPSKPGSISGLVPVCPPATGTIQQTYCINPVSNATSYQWTITGNSNPSLSIASGQGTTCVVINIPAGYNGNQDLEVKAGNCKGFGSAREIDIKKFSTLSTPNAIGGPSSVCKSQVKTYNTNTVNGATSYAWFVTGGAQIISGQGTKSVQISFANCTTTTVVITVTASNSCFTSNPRTQTVTVNLNCKTSNDALAEPQEVNLNSISLYPNPTSGKTTLSINSIADGKFNMKVFDVIGKVLINEDLTLSEGLNTKEINLENVSHGLYFVTIRSEGMESQTLRIIVE